MLFRYDSDVKNRKYLLTLLKIKIMPLIKIPALDALQKQIDAQSSLISGVSDSITSIHSQAASDFSATKVALDLIHADITNLKGTVQRVIDILQGVFTTLGVEEILPSVDVPVVLTPTVLPTPDPTPIVEATPSAPVISTEVTNLPSTQIAITAEVLQGVPLSNIPDRVVSLGLVDSDSEGAFSIKNLSSSIISLSSGERIFPGGSINFTRIKTEGALVIGVPSILNP